MNKQEFQWIMVAGIGGLFLLGFVIHYSFFDHPAPAPSATGVPFDGLFRSISDEEELWKAFQSRVESPGPDEDLGAIFASFWARRESVRGESSSFDVREHWTKMARAATDLRVRDLFLAYRARGDRMDGSGCGFDAKSSQVRVGDPLPFIISGNSVRLERRRMTFSEGWSLQATDQVDTIELAWRCFDTSSYARLMSGHRGCSGNFETSKPMLPGIWRFTLLSDDVFREVYLNITENDVALEMDHEGFLLWTGGEAEVRLWNAKDTIVRNIGPEGFLRYSIDPPASGQMEYNLAVRQGESVYFRKLSWVRRDADSRVNAVAWTDRTEYQPGDTVRLHGIVRAFDAQGRRSFSDLHGPLLLQFYGKPFPKGHSQNLTMTPDGHFHGSVEIPLDANDGSATAFLDNRLESTRNVDSGSVAVSGWRTLGESDDFLRFDVRKEPRARVASIHSSWDRADYREGDTAVLRVRVLDKNRKPWSGQVGMECRWAGGVKRSDLSTNRHGMAEWSFRGLRKGEIRADVVAEVGDSILWGRSEAEAFSDREALPRAASLSVSVAKNPLEAGQLEVKVESPHELAPVQVLVRGRRIGEARHGRVVAGRFVASLPIGDPGQGRWIVAYVKGPANMGSRSVRVPEADERDVHVVSHLSKTGQEVTALLDVTDFRGNGLSSWLTVAVVGNPSAAPGFDTLASSSGGGGSQSIERDFPYREFLYRGIWAGKFEDWYDNQWTGAGRARETRSRSVERIENSVHLRNLEDPSEIRFDPHRPWKEGDRFGPSSNEFSPACTRMAYWSDSVQTSAQGKAKVRFKLPPGKQDWYLVIRGTAGEHLLVSHIVKI